MRKILSLLLLMTATMMAWTGAYAQTDAEYEAAMAAIQENGVYYVKSDVGGTYYYLKGDGYLTATKADAAKFIFQKVASDGGFKEYGFKLNNNNTYFSNPPGTSEESLKSGHISTSTRQDNNQYEAQVFFLNTEGKYAVRAGNPPAATSSWAWVAGSYWTIVGDVDPVAQYQWAADYRWELEEDAFAEQQLAASNTLKSWPFFVQSAAGLVKDASKYSSNAVQTTEGSIAALLDDNYTTYFHSCWSNGPDEDHYLQAELTEATQKFEFYFKKRSQNNNNRPTVIAISASNDGTTFTDITTLNEGFPTDESVISYLSGVIDLGAAYKYVRFTVKDTNNQGQNNGHYFFTFSEFYMFPGMDEAAQVAAAYNTYAAKPWKDLTETDIAQINAIDKQLRAAFSTVNVTYELYDSDGTTLLGSKTVVQEPGSDVEIPASLATQPQFFDYTPSGAIGNSDCTIKVTRTLKPGFVGALADLSNSKAYTIACDRGKLLTKDGYLASTAHSSLTTAEPSNFAIISYEGNYYLYSVADSKFVQNNGALADKPSNGVFDALKMDPKSVPYFMYYFTVSEGTNYGLNTNGNDPYGYVINNWMNADPGNQYYMIAAADFDATSALAALDAQFHPAYSVIYVVKDAFGNTIFTSDPEPVEQGAKITTLPEKYHRAYYSYNDVDVTVSEPGGTQAVFTATWGGPFVISENFANAHWYDMTMRGIWYVTSAEKDASDGAYVTQKNAPKSLQIEDSYQWAFIGDGYNGFKIVNKAEGEGKSLGWTDDNQKDAGIPTVMADGEGNHAWRIVASTSTSVPAGSFVLNVAGTNLYPNQYGGEGRPMKFWNSANNLGDAGAAFTVYDVPTFAEVVTAEIAPALEATGYFAFTDAVKATFGYDPAYKTECPFETYKSMKEKLDAIDMSDLTNFVLPETGYYTLKNSQYGTFMGIDPSDANLYGNYKTATAAKQIVKLIKTGDKYSIGLMGKFAPAAVAQSAQVTADAEAGIYTLVIPVVGYAAFQADPENNMSVLHCAGGGSIVGWEASAEASQWAVEDAQSITLSIGEQGYATAYLPFPVEVGKTISIPAAKGAWTFEDGTTGSMTATEGVTVADGVATVPVGDNLKVTHGFTDPGNYSFMMDVKVLNENKSAFTSLFMTGNDREDGGLFIYYNKKDGSRKIGINIGGMGYQSSIELDTWYRIVFSCENYIPTVYVDGVKVAAATQAINKLHWTLSDDLYFFADNDGEENDVQTSEIRLWDVALTAEEVEMLGAAGAEVPEPTSVVAYTGKAAKTYLALTPVEGTIPALTGVVLKGDPGVYEFAIAAEAAPIEDNDLKGTLEPIEADGKYILAKPEGEEIGFYQATTGNIAAGKAYLDVASDIKGFLFSEDGATGIANVEKAAENGPIYNIAGQRLSKVQKGINIVNGKKVLY